MKTTIADYLTTISSPLINTATASYQSVPDFIKDKDFLDILETYILDNFGEYELLRRYAERQDDIPSKLTYMYAANAYMLKGLWETTQLEYNPIENYDRFEDTTDTNSGTDTTTDNLGKTHTHESLGNRQDTTASAEKTETNTHDVSPENTTNFIHERRDTITRTPYNDTYTQGAQENDFNSDSVKNTSELEYGHVLDRKSHIHGNIGVTTTMQMIDAQRDTLNFNIYKVVGDLIISKIAKRVWTDF